MSRTRKSRRRRTARGGDDNYRVVQRGGKWYVEHKDHLGEWNTINPQGHGSKEEAEMELKEVREMYSRRDRCANCGRRQKEADFLRSLNEDDLLDEWVLTAENEGTYYPDKPGIAVARIKEDLVNRFKDVLDRLEREAVERVDESWNKRSRVQTGNNPPREVQKVYEEAKQSAIDKQEMEGEDWDVQKAIVRFDESRGLDDKEAWKVTDKLGRAPALFYYPNEDRWTYMQPYGSEKEISYREALANAELMFHG